MTTYGFAIFVFNDLMSNGYKVFNWKIFWKMAKEKRKRFIQIMPSCILE